MFRLLESIYLKDGVFRNLPYHEERMRKSWRDLFDSHATIDLYHYFNTIGIPSKGFYKTRVIYDIEIRKVEFVPYVVKPVRSLMLLHSDTISYDYKFLDRQDIDQIYSQRGNADDVLIVKNGFITDTSYANIIFKKEKVWYTPIHCLLKGTMRQSLLDARLIRETTIDVNNYSQFESFRLINSLLGMDGEEIRIEFIV
jgi:4-amino-4-deoxychorismate lyase